MGQKSKVARNIMLRIYEEEKELLEIFDNLERGVSANAFIKQAVLYYTDEKKKEAKSEEQTTLILQTLNRLNRNTDELYEKIKTLDLTGVSEPAIHADQESTIHSDEKTETEGKISPGTNEDPPKNVMDDVMGFLKS